MPTNKRMNLFDSSKSKETTSVNRTWARGEVIFKKLGTDEVLLTLHNKVIIAGSQMVASKVFNLPEWSICLPIMSPWIWRTLLLMALLLPTLPRSACSAVALRAAVPKIPRFIL